MLRQINLTNVSESIEAKYCVGAGAGAGFRKQNRIEIACVNGPLQFNPFTPFHSQE